MVLNMPMIILLLGNVHRYLIDLHRASRGKKFARNNVVEELVLPKLLIGSY